MTLPSVMDLVVDAYSIVAFQMSLNSIHADESGYSFSNPFEENGLWVLKDEIKFYDQKLDRFIPIKFTANEDRLYAEVLVTLPIILKNAGELDILKVVNRMNNRAGAFSSFFNPKAEEIEIYSYLSYFGSPTIFGKEPGQSYEYEVQAFANILSGMLEKASYWVDKLALLESSENSAYDVFRLIK